jgi:hypothetical protein
MRFTVDIKCKNELLGDNRPSHETARILTAIAHDLLVGNFAEDESDPIRDREGNEIGQWHFES